MKDTWLTKDAEIIRAVNGEYRKRSGAILIFVFILILFLIGWELK